MFPYGITVTRQRGTAVLDPYSGEETGISWADPDEIEVEGCAFNPGGSTEPVEVGRAAVVSKPTVYAPFGADIRAKDRLKIGDTTYDVDGRPAPFKNPFTGWEPGLVVTLKDVEG